MITSKHKLKYAVIATDAVLFTIDDKKLKVLLMRVDRPPYFKYKSNYWAVPGGLIHPKETAGSAAKRHLYGKAGLKNVYLEQLYTFSKVSRDPRGRVIAVSYFALVPKSNTKIKNSEDIKWYPVKRLPKLAYDHKEMIKYAEERLRAKLEYTNIVYALLQKEFTLGDLQEIYEIILGRKLDKRNFRKKILSLDMIKKSRKKRLGESNRPAGLYYFKKRNPQVIEIM